MQKKGEVISVYTETTATLAERYGCSKSAMRHRIFRHIAKINRDAVHAIQDIRSKQWTVDKEGVAILDTMYPVKNPSYTLVEKISDTKEILSLHEEVKSLKEKIDSLLNLVKEKVSPEKNLDDELIDYCNSNPNVHKVRRTGISWKKQIIDAIKYIAVKNKYPEGYQTYQIIYNGFKKKNNIDLYELRDTYKKTHYRQYGSKNPSILEALNHSEPEAILFTEYINSLLTK